MKFKQFISMMLCMSLCTGTPVSAEELEKKYSYILNKLDQERRLLSETFMDENDQRVNGSEGYAEKCYEYDEHGNCIITRYLDAAGNPWLDPRGYAYVRKVYNAKNQVTAEVFCDVNGNPMNVDGYAVVHMEYDEQGNLSSMSYRDENDSSVMMGQGYSYQTYTYSEDGSKVRIAYFDRSGNPVMIDADYASISYEYDSEGRVITELYYDVAGNPHVPEGGLSAGTRFEYDKAGNITSRYCLGEYAEKVICSEGYCRYSCVYDGAGRPIQEVYYNIVGKPVMNTEKGYAYVLREYDQYGNETKTRYFDNNDQPTEVDGIASIKREFDINGNCLSIRQYDSKGRFLSDATELQTTAETEDLLTETDGKVLIDGQLVEVHTEYVDDTGEDTGTVLSSEDLDQSQDRGTVLSSEDLDQSQETGAEQLSDMEDPQSVLQGTEAEQLSDMTDPQLALSETVLDGQPVASQPVLADNEDLVQEDGSEYEIAKVTDQENNSFIAYTIEDRFTLLMETSGFTYILKVYNENKDIMADLFRGSVSSPDDFNGYFTARKLTEGEENSIIIGCFDENDNPVVLQNGSSIIKVRINKDTKPARIEFFDEEGYAVLAREGYASIGYEFDAQGRIVEELYYDTDELLMIPSGRYYAGREFVYDKDNNIAGKYFLGIDGNRVVGEDGYCGYCCIYDEDKRILEEKYVDADGNLAIRLPEYYSIVRHVYDEDGNETHTMYYDDSARLISGVEPEHYVPPMADTEDETDIVPDTEIAPETEAVVQTNPAVETDAVAEEDIVDAGQMEIIGIGEDAEVPVMTEIVDGSEAAEVPVMTEIVDGSEGTDVPVMTEIVDDSEAAEVPVMTESTVVSDETQEYSIDDEFDINDEEEDIDLSDEAVEAEIDDFAEASGADESNEDGAVNEADTMTGENAAGEADNSGDVSASNEAVTEGITNFFSDLEALTKESTAVSDESTEPVTNFFEGLERLTAATDTAAESDDTEPVTDVFEDMENLTEAISRNADGADAGSEADVEAGDSTVSDEMNLNAGSGEASGVNADGTPNEASGVNADGTSNEASGVNADGTSNEVSNENEDAAASDGSDVSGNDAATVSSDASDHDAANGASDVSPDDTDHGEAGEQDLEEAETDSEFELIQADENKELVRNKVTNLYYLWFYNEQRQVVRQASCDANGTPVTIGDYAQVTFEYDQAGNVSYQAYYDQDGRSLTLPAGYHAMRTRYDSHQNLLRADFLDMNDKLVLLAEDYSTQILDYDDAGRLIMETYYGLNGELVALRAGYAICATYYIDDYVAETRYYGTSGQPVNTVEGYAVHRVETGMDGLVTREEYLDTEGNPVNLADGYASYEVVYFDDGTQMITYYDANGMTVKTEG